MNASKTANGIIENKRVLTDATSAVKPLVQGNITDPYADDERR